MKILVAVFCLFVGFNVVTVTEVDSVDYQKVIYDGSDSEADYVYNPTTERSYKLHTTFQTWDEATAACAAEGAHLAVINNLGEAEVIQEMLTDNYISLLLTKKDQASVRIGFRFEDGEWKTVDGQTLDEAGYSDWGLGQPSNYEHNQYCGGVFWGQRFLDDLECDKPYLFICEKNKKTDYVVYANIGSAYKLHTIPETWDNSNTICSDEGGSLAVINSPKEAEVVKKILSDKAAHVIMRNYDQYTVAIGFRYVNDEWITVDGKTLSEAGYEVWSPGEPNNYKTFQQCGGVVRGTKLFDDIQCAYRHLFLCEKNAFH